MVKSIESGPPLRDSEISSSPLLSPEQQVSKEWDMVMAVIPQIKSAQSLDELYDIVVSVLPNIFTKPEVTPMEFTEKQQLLNEWLNIPCQSVDPNHTYSVNVINCYKFQNALKDKLPLLLQDRLKIPRKRKS